MSRAITKSEIDGADTVEGITLTIYKRTKNYCYGVEPGGKHHRIHVPAELDTIMVPGAILNNVVFAPKS